MNHEALATLIGLSAMIAFVIVCRVVRTVMDRRR